MSTRFSFLLRLPVIMLIAHVYVAGRLAAGMDAPTARAGVLAGLTLSYALILAGFFKRRATGQTFGNVVAWAGFLCLGMFSWLFVLSAIRDALLLVGTVVTGVYRLVATEASLAELTALVIHEGLPWLGEFRSFSAILVPALALVATVVGFHFARRTPPVKDVEIRLPQLPAALEDFRIVQLTDMHVGPTIRRGRVERMVAAANRLDAHIVALTGDLVDGTVNELRPHVEPLSRLRAAYGVYAVTGNHEYYSGALPWIAEWRRLGMRVLCNEHVVIHHNGADILLAGINDYSAGAFDHHHASNPQEALHGAPSHAALRIMLAHQPRSATAVEASGFDLQLSGHTHGGQFWPWNHFVRLQQPFVAGLHQLGRLHIYISRGCGYWGPPLRLGAPAEITLIRLARKHPA